MQRVWAMQLQESGTEKHQQQHKHNSNGKGPQNTAAAQQSREEQSNAEHSTAQQSTAEQTRVAQRIATQWRTAASKQRSNTTTRHNMTAAATK